MDIAQYLSAADVRLDADARNKAELLEILATEAAGRLGRPREEIHDALKAREALGSTALGRGVALPHAQLGGVASPLVLFLRLRRAIDFDDRDGEPVDLIFLVLWPIEDAKGLLDAVAEVCRALGESQVLRRLRHAETPEAVIQILRDQNAPGAA